MPAIRKLPSGKWQATIRDPSGRKITKTHALKGAVKTWAEDAEATIKTGGWVDPQLGKITLSDWWDRWQVTRRVETATASRNESQWRVHVRPRFGPWPLAKITSWEIEGWVNNMIGAGVGPTTVKSALRILRHMLADAVKHRVIPTNPAELVTAPTPPRHIDRMITHEEADRIIAELDGQDQLFARVLFGTGLRWSECAALWGGNLDLMRRLLHVEASLRRDGTRKQPKTPSGIRTLPLPDDLVAALSVQMTGRAPTDYVFTSTTGGPLTYMNWWSRAWRPAVTAAGLDEPLPTPHDARHAYGTWLGEAGLPESDIGALMGHSPNDRRSTARYVHATSSRFDRARDALARAAIEGRTGTA